MTLKPLSPFMAVLLTAGLLFTAPLALSGPNPLETTALGVAASRTPPAGLTALNASLPEGFASFAGFHTHNTRIDPDTWNARGQWDPLRQRTFFFGDRHASVFHTYFAASHAWAHNALDETIPTAPHQYGGVALDAQRGHFYRKAGGALYRYVIDEDRWEVASASVPVGGTSAIDFHEGLDAVVGVWNYTLFRFKEGGWSTINSAFHRGHHTNVLYNRVRGDMIIVGGNHTPSTVALLDAGGSLRLMQEAPFDFTAQHHILSYDPQSGNYLVMHRKDYTIWEYSPGLDEWRLARDWRADAGDPWPFGPYFGHLLVPVDELGVILWIHRNGPRVYRHQSAFDAEDAEIRNRVADPISVLPPSSEEDGSRQPRSDSDSVAPPESRGGESAGFPAEPDESRESVTDATYPSRPAPVASASQLTSSDIRIMREAVGMAAPSVPVDRRSTELSAAAVHALRSGEEPPAVEPPERPGPAVARELPASGTAPKTPAPSERAVSDRPEQLEPPPAQSHPPHEALAAIGRDMQPGEWRYVETANRPNFRVQFCPEEKGSTHALGWTNSFAYEPQTQSFWALGMRGRSEKRLFFLNRDLEWNEVRVPVDECATDRRPFNRLTVVDGYLYWPSSQAVGGDRRARGEMWRAPIQPFLEGRTDVEWEQFSSGLDIGNMNNAGDFAVEYYPEMGGWVFFGRRSGTSSPTPFSQEGHTAEGAALGKSWYGQALFFKPGDAAWTFFDRAYTGQYRGRLLYNPVKREMLLAPGGEFGSQPEQDAPQREWAIVRHSGGLNDLVRYSGDGPIPWIEKLDRVVGDDLPNFSLRYSTLTYNPSTGGYLWWDRREEVIWSSADGKTWVVYEDFADITGSRFPQGRERFRGSSGLFGATGYVQMNALPGTDLILFVDPDTGVILHRLKSD